MVRWWWLDGDSDGEMVMVRWLFHFVYGASPPTHLASIPHQFAWFPKKIASPPQKFASFPPKISHFPTLFCGTLPRTKNYLQNIFDIFFIFEFELEPHILPRLMPDKKIYHFQIPKTTPTNGLKKWLFWWFMRLVRVPPYESWANRSNFFSFWEKGFFWGGQNLL